MLLWHQFKGRAPLFFQNSVFGNYLVVLNAIFGFGIQCQDYSVNILFFLKYIRWMLFYIRMVAVLGACATLGGYMSTLLIHTILSVGYQLGMALAMLNQTLDLSAGYNSGLSEGLKMLCNHVKRLVFGLYCAYIVNYALKIHTRTCISQSVCKLINKYNTQ